MLDLRLSWYLHLAKWEDYSVRFRSGSRRMGGTAICPLAGNIHRDLAATAQSLFHVSLWGVLDSVVGVWVGWESWLEKVGGEF